MHIALFGATGGTGRQVLDQGIAQGHCIAALVRDPAKLPDQPGLTKVRGDVLDPEPVSQCVTGADAVICVLGSHGRQDPIEARGTERIIDAMRASGVRRFIVVTSLGVGDSRPRLSWPVRLMMDVMLGPIMRAKEAQETLVKASGLDWTIVRPGGLTNGPRTGSYRLDEDPSVKPGRVSRADVADFVLRQLADDSFLHRTPAVI